MSKTIYKSIGAILAGFITVFVLSVVTDLILEKIGFLPAQDHPEQTLWWMLLIALIYRTIYSIAGFYLTARLAPNKPMKHALILGVIGTVFATLGAAANWNKSDNWYPILLILVTLPSAWLGAKLQIWSKK